MISGRGMAKWFAHTLLTLIFGTIAIVVAVWGQQIEATWMPVVSEVAPTDRIYRDAKKACFALHLTKNADAVPGPYEFWGQAHLSPKLPLSAYISDGEYRKYAQDPTNHPPGTKWTRFWCFELPATVADNQALTIYGHASHDRHNAQHTWYSLSYFKPFKICGLVPDDPPPDAPQKPDPFCDKQREGFAKP